MIEKEKKMIRLATASAVPDSAIFEMRNLYHLFCSGKPLLCQANCLIATLVAACFAMPAHAQFQQLSISQIHANATTDGTVLNTDDEVYFVVTGAISRANGQIETVNMPRVSPPPPNDYYLLAAGRSALNIPLWQGFVGRGDTAFLNVVVAEQDNAQLGFIANLATSAAAAVGAAFGAPTLEIALAKAKDAVESLVKSLDSSADDVIAAFAVTITNNNGVFNVSWQSTHGDTRVALTTANPALILAKGGGSDYVISPSVTRPPLPQIRVTHSGMCLDVVGASLNDQANVQQYPCNLGGNQRWKLQVRGAAVPPPPGGWLPRPYFAVVNEGRDYLWNQNVR